ncbi:MAG TPA: sugar ABC transporter substrate-binding protein, partial [Agromyces sp.]|nr:sugar ABC transporter substrate-binding protein [Agromyces sp.]
MKKARRTTALALVSGAVSVGLLLTGCTPNSGGGAAQGPVSQEDIDKAMSTPTKLTFWTWVPDIENEVKLFEEKYPEIDVTVENVGQGLPHYQKLRSAIEAGEGAPDVAQIE